VPTGKDKVALTGWTDRQKNIPSEDTVKADFSKPGTCVAIIAGKVSGNAEIIDFDFKAEFFTAFCNLVDKDVPDLIEKLVIQSTQSGGCHIGFRCPDVQIPGNSKLAAKWIEVDNDGEHQYYGKKLKAVKRNGKYYITPCYIETRGNGGYALVAPSTGYALLQGKFSQLPKITAYERKILIEAAKALNERPSLQ
jgi:hypothetical protein